MKVNKIVDTQKLTMITFPTTQPNMTAEKFIVPKLD